MEKRVLGKTGLEVTAIGFGSSHIGFRRLPKAQCDIILNGVLDAGINLIDTAQCYGEAEDQIGHAIAHRRDQYVLVSKCGHPFEGSPAEAWSAGIIRPSAERSLRRLRSEYLDVLLLHSCPIKNLRDEKMIEALVGCQRAGLTRYIGYSGDGEAAAFALRMGIFDVLETSLNICDQQVIETNLARARHDGVGVLIKRAMANSCWRDLDRVGDPEVEYSRPYIERFRQMRLALDTLAFEGDWPELALRFTVHQPGVSSALIGGMNLEHVRENVRMAEKGPLPAHVVQNLRETWKMHDDGTWEGQV